jgi:hypothetical protein
MIATDKVAPCLRTQLKLPRRRVAELLTDRHASLPVWIRAPKSGPEHYSGISRSKLYELDKKGKILSRSIREPGQIRGTRLFNLKSILDFIDACDTEEPES